jgi:ABC-type proline/glycine betaine transport system ATPase subunit
VLGVEIAIMVNGSGRSAPAPAAPPLQTVDDPAQVAVRALPPQQHRERHRVFGGMVARRNRRRTATAPIPGGRIGIAQALLNDPELLIVDEPTSGLDPEERIRFRTLLSQLAERRTVLLSTHIVNDVAQTCTELAVLGRGRLIYRGTVGDLTERANGKVWSLVSSGPAPSVGTVVSVLPHDGATRYRIVAATRPSADAQPVVPTLEDGYVLLAQQHSLTAAESAA